MPKQHIDFECRGVLDKSFLGDTLSYGILFKTHSERKRFIEAALKQLKEEADA